MLHSQIQNLILKYPCHGEGAQQILVLITGDGNANDNRTSFPEILTLALDHGWGVELWSWKASLSMKFSDIQKKYPSTMQIKHLDEHRSKITFKQKAQQNQQTNNNYIQPWMVFSCLIFSVVLGIYFYSFEIFQDNQ